MAFKFQLSSLMSEVPVKVICSRPPGAPRPKVSVAMITYNHEKFIRQAVESVMMQETAFPYELVIGEDCSADRTREICLELQQKYTDRIRLLLPERNLGAKANEAYVFRACDGDYIALLEGDDFWLDPRKLQDQVDFLQHNPDCSACFALARVVSDGDPSSWYYIPAKTTPSRRFTTEDLLDRNWIATCSLLFRNVIAEIPFKPFDHLAMGDWPLNIMLSLRGPIGYLNREMAAYRQHAGGIWTGAQEVLKLTEVLHMYQALVDLLPRQFSPQLTAKIIKCHQLIALELLRKGQRAASCRHTLRSLASVPILHALAYKWYVKRSGVLLLGSLGMPPDTVERRINGRDPKAPSPAARRAMARVKPVDSI